MLRIRLATAPWALSAAFTMLATPSVGAAQPVTATHEEVDLNRE